MTFTVADFTREMKALRSEIDSDFRYEVSLMDRFDGDVRYVDDHGKPLCLIATVLDRLGYPMGELVEHLQACSQPAFAEMPTYFTAAVQCAQDTQDNHQPWHTAIDDYLDSLHFYKLQERFIEEAYA